MFGTNIPNAIRAKRRKEINDFEFMQELKIMSLIDLEKTLENHSHKSVPRWKKVAIRRAISKLTPKPYSWIIGLDELDKNLSHMESWKRDLVIRSKQRIMEDEQTIKK